MMEALRSVPLFSLLDASELAEVQSLALPFETRPGEPLFRQGEESDGMYVITKGSVRVSTRLLGEDDVELLQLGPGEILGELSLLDRGLRSASASAVLATSGCFFGNRSFEVLRAGFRPAALKVMRYVNVILCRRIRDVCGEIAELEYSIAPPSLRAPPTSLRIPPRSNGDPNAVASVETLRAIPFFREFSQRDLQSLLEKTNVRSVSAGQLLIEQGSEADDACFIVARGAVQQFVNRDTRSENLGVLGPGKVFGQVAMLDRLAQPASFRVRERSVLIEIERTAFRELTTGGSALAFKFSDLFTQSLAETLRANTRQLGRLLAEGSVRRARSSVLQSEVDLA